MQPLTPPIDRELPPPLAWRATELSADAGRTVLTDEALGEIDRVTGDLRDNPLPLLALVPQDFDMPACTALMREVRRELDEGLGFAIIDRLPLDRISREEAKAIYWLLGSMISRPVAQKWDGTMIYDVHDTGKKPGHGVRPDITNVEQNFHTDNSYNLCSPGYVGLFCLQKAREGGMSSLVSFSAAHNELRRQRPDLLPRLYAPFVFDRQREHAEGDAMTLSHAMFENHDERLVGRLSRFQVVNGYKLAGEEIDAKGAEALEALEEIMNAPGMGLEFWFEPGQIQIVNNRLIGHRRTAFVDWPEEERKRWLVRLWLRDEGRPFYNG